MTGFVQIAKPVIDEAGAKSRSCVLNCGAAVSAAIAGETPAPQEDRFGQFESRRFLVAREVGHDNDRAACLIRPAGRRAVSLDEDVRGFGIDVGDV